MLTTVAEKVCQTIVCNRRRAELLLFNNRCRRDLTGRDPDVWMRPRLRQRRDVRTSQTRDVETPDRDRTHS